MPQTLRVLIAEDNPVDAELMRRQLEQAGFKLDWERVDTLADYVARLHERFDLILSDFQMPQFGGLEALEALNQSGLEIPFILVSGTMGEDLAVAAMKSGAADYLLKDRLTRLGPAVKHALDQGRLRRERKRTELALVESERRFRELLENVELIAMTLDNRGIVTFCNDFLLRLTGWSRDEVVNCEWGAKFIPESMPEVMETFFDNIMVGKVPMHHENPIKTKSGDLRVIAWNNTLLRDAAGKICGTASIGADITEQKNAAEKIRDQLDELLRWQEVMLNREERVVLLKQEVNELLAAQNQPARYALEAPP
jgi:PAS domain S-box-containing protein